MIRTRALLGYLSLLIAIGLASSLGGCGASRPAPVEGWEWGLAAPPGYYRVRRGDTLSEIAERQRIPLSRLAGWNGLKSPYTIYSGRLLRIQPPMGRSGPPVAPATPHPPVKGIARVPADQSRDVPKPAVASRVATPQRAAVPTPDSRHPAATLVWAWPLDGPILQGFRQGDSTRQGIRIGGRPGEQVRASATGQVVYSGGGLKGYGNLIIIKHNKNYLSAYGFNRRLFVREGDSVKRGQVLAEVGQGASGDYVLHFEVRRNGTAVDPMRYLPARN